MLFFFAIVSDFNNADLEGSVAKQVPVNINVENSEKLTLFISSVFRNKSAALFR